MSPPNEPYLKSSICPHCHVAILSDHPEEKFAILGFKKCVLCGFTIKVEVVVPEVRRIINGRNK